MTSGWGNLLGSAATAAASTLAAKGVASLFGGGDTISTPTVAPVTGISASTPAFGLTGSFSGGNSSTSLTSKGSPTQLAFARRFPGILGNFQSLQAFAKPFASEFRATANAEIDTGLQKTLSDLKQTTAQRGVSGLPPSLTGELTARADATRNKALASIEAGKLEATIMAEATQAEYNAILEQQKLEYQQLGLSTNLATALGNYGAQVAMAQGRIDAEIQSLESKMQQFKTNTLTEIAGGIFGAATTQNQFRPQGLNPLPVGTVLQSGNTGAWKNPG